MPFSAADFVWGVAAPAIVSGVVFLAVGRLGRGDAASRQAAALAVTAGFLAAYVAYDWAPLAPKESWQWLPYLAVAAAIVAPAGLAQGIGRIERGALFLVLGAAAAWFLVPDWKEIEPTRHRHMLTLGAGTWLLCWFWDATAGRIRGGAMPISVFFAASAGAAVLGFAGILKFVHLAAALAAGVAGWLLASLIRSRETSFRGATAACAVLLGGLMYSGRVSSYSGVPLASYVLVPAAPVCLWVLAAGLLSRLPMGWRAVAGVAVVILPLTVAVVLAATAGPAW